MSDAPSPSSLESLVGQVADEFLRRQQQGELPDIEEYTARYPEAASLLRNVLNSLQLIEQSAPPIEAEATSATLGDFVLLREIGRGGMGVVYEAEQISLRRRVAVKVLPYAATLDERRLQRFKMEAQAAAQLHHPNIVPVYAVGCERGIHYYAMQFIEGRTLSVLIEEFRAANVATPSPRSTALPSGEFSYRNEDYFRRAAELIAQAADALDHTHQAGIIHRDIKPSNLLLDPQGKLWITDFGLAHCQSEASLTATGDLVGTLRYMSPEQARGGRAAIDARSDVYSLGATLYEILTLQPALDGMDREVLFRKIASEEPIALRRQNKDIPRELEIIVQKALSKAPEERYATAQELADDLRRFLEDRPIRARPPSVIQRLGKWLRRHRFLVAMISLMMVGLALLVGAFILRLEQRRAATVAAVTAYLDGAELLQEQGRWSEARATLARAEERLSVEGPESLRQRVQRLQDDLDWVVDLDKARLYTAESNGTLGVNFSGANRAYREAFARRQLNVETGDAAEVVQRIQELAIRDALVQALDHWAFVKEQLHAGDGEPLLGLARRIDADPWRQQLRDRVLWENRDPLDKLASEPAATAQPAVYLVLLTFRLDMVGAPATSERLLRRAQADHPEDFWLNLVLANLLNSVRDGTPSRWEEAVGFYRAALVQRPRSDTVLLNMGVALGLLNRPKEAEQAFRKVLEVRGPSAPAYSNLASVLGAQQRLTEAEQACHQAIDLQPDFAQAHNNLGNVLMNLGKVTDAEKELRRAIALNTTNPEAHQSLGGLLGRQGKLVEAEKEFRAVLALRPDNAVAHANLGLACQQQGKLEEAEKEERRAIELHPGYAEAWFNLANVLIAKRQFNEAEEALRRAIACKPDFAAARHNLQLLLQERAR
jgi:serine/threonine protein kinase/Flp pilus assembly protein TadD